MNEIQIIDRVHHDVSDAHKLLSKQIANLFLTMTFDNPAYDGDPDEHAMVKPVYMSTPMSSGPRLVEALKNGIDLTEAKELVFEANIAASVELISKVRNFWGLWAITPTPLSKVQDSNGKWITTPFELPWTQDEFRYFWGVVVANHVSDMILADGWWGSNGCSYEFYVAIANGIDCYDSEGDPITLEKGLEMIKEGIALNDSVGLDTKFLNAVAKEIEREINSKLVPA